MPAHIGTPTPGHGYESGDPFADFFPPAIPIPDDDDGTSLRALVVVRQGTEKVGQEYVHPLLMLTGREYTSISFAELHDRICDALRGRRPRIVAQFSGGDGNSRLIYEDGSTREMPSDETNRQE